MTKASIKKAVSGPTTCAVLLSWYSVASPAAVGDAEAPTEAPGAAADASPSMMCEVKLRSSKSYLSMKGSDVVRKVRGKEGGDRHNSNPLCRDQFED